jgi:hypothetical protein
VDDKFQAGTQPNPKLAGDEHNPFQLPTKSVRKDEAAEAWRVLFIFLALLGAMALGVGLLAYFIYYHGLLDAPGPPRMP